MVSLRLAAPNVDAYSFFHQATAHSVGLFVQLQWDESVQSISLPHGVKNCGQRAAALGTQ